MIDAVIESMASLALPVQDGFIRDVTDKATAETLALQKLSGGLKVGGSWREGLPEDAAWDDVKATYTQKLGSVQHRGISALISKAMATAKTEYENITKLLNGLVGDAALAEQKTAYDKAVKASRISLAEAALVQCLKNAKTPKETLQVQVTGIVEKMIGIVLSDVHPAIEARAELAQCD